MKYIPFSAFGHRWVPSMEGVKVKITEEAIKKGSPEKVAGWTCTTIPGAAITVTGTTVDEVFEEFDVCALTHGPSGLAMPGRGTARKMAELAATMVADLQADFTMSEAAILKALPKHKLWDMFSKRVEMGAFGRLVNTTPDAVVFTTGYLPAEGWLALIKSMKKGGSVRVERPDGRGVDLHGDDAVLRCKLGAVLKLNPIAWCSLDVREYLPLDCPERRELYVGPPRPVKPVLVRAVLDIIGQDVRFQCILWESAELAPLCMVPCEEQGEDTDELSAVG